MKRILLSLFVAVVAIPATAQLDRSVRPEPGPAREPEIAEFEEFELENGLNLIVVENHKLPRVSMQLTLDIDPIFEGEKAGMISIAGDMLSEGTTNRSKEELDEEVDFIGARLATYSTGAFVSGLSKYDQTLIGILADVVLNPQFSQESFDKLKELTISGIKSNAEDPGTMMSHLWGSRIYGLDHAYGEFMTEESVENVTLQDCKNYYNTYFKPNKAYLVIVGDIDPDDAEEMVEEYFSNWERGEVPSHEVAVPELPSSTYIAFMDRPTSEQSQIQIGNRVELPLGAEDLEAVRLANMILGGGSLGRLYLNLREDKAFTYGAYSSIGTDEHVSTFVASGAVKNAVTDSAVVEFLNEINRIRTELVSEEELQNAKNYLAGSFGRSLESPQTVANFGLRVKQYNLDDDYYNDYLKRLDAVTAEQVRAAAQKYFTAENLTIAVVGKGSEVLPGLEAIAEVQRFDRYGNPASDAIPVPDGMTAMDVINMYIESIGGEQRISQISNFKQTMSGTIQGMTITITEMWMSPDKYKVIQDLPQGQMISIVNGENVTMSMGGQAMPVSEERKAEQIADATPFEMRDFASLEMKLLPEMVEVNGTQTFAVEMTVNGSPETHYFDGEKGYRVRSTSIQEGPRGETSVSVDYSNYEDVNGVMIPKSVMIPLGPGMSMEMKVQSAAYDSEEVTPDMFQ